MSQDIRRYIQILSEAAPPVTTDWRDWHGHVRPRPDGVKMRCGGPRICSTCRREEQQTATLGESVLTERQDITGLHARVEAVFAAMVDALWAVDATGPQREWVTAACMILYRAMADDLSPIIQKILPGVRVTVDPSVAACRDADGVVHRDQVAGSFAAKKGHAYLSLTMAPALLDTLRDRDMDKATFAAKWVPEYTDTVMHELSHAGQHVNRTLGDDGEYKRNAYANDEGDGHYLAVTHEIEARAMNAALEIKRAHGDAMPAAREMVAASPTLQTYLRTFGATSPEWKRLVRATHAILVNFARGQA